MIIEQGGNLLQAEAQALVNTVNTVGVMGKGIALQFKRAFPENYKAYRKACEQGEVQLGKMFVWNAGSLLDTEPNFIVNFPTKKHWRSRSRITDIEEGLDDLVRVINELNIKSVAVPPLGCGQGGLEWSDVKPLIEKALGRLYDVEVLLFPPGESPAANQQPVRSDMPRMTPGRAALIGIMSRYLPHSLDVTAVDIQKLMYFMQSAGEPLRLTYQKGTYGPYADNLRHVLNSMEGHYISGLGDGSHKALDVLPFKLLSGAEEAAQELLSQRSETRERVSRVAELVEGFESTYGLELLATVHWAATNSANDEHHDLDAIVNTVQSWSARKSRLFTERHVRTALDRLRSLGWIKDSLEPSLIIA